MKKILTHKIHIAQKPKKKKYYKIVLLKLNFSFWNETYDKPPDCHLNIHIKPDTRRDMIATWTHFKYIQFINHSFEIKISNHFWIHKFSCTSLNKSIATKNLIPNYANYKSHAFLYVILAMFFLYILNFLFFLEFLAKINHFFLNFLQRKINVCIDWLVIVAICYRLTIFYSLLV